MIRQLTKEKDSWNKLHSPEEDEIVLVLKEESENLRAKVIQLTEKNNKLLKEAEKIKLQCEREKQEQLGSYISTIEQQRQEISKLKEAQYELNEIKGQQMLQAFELRKPFTGHSVSEETPGAETEPEEETKDSARLLESEVDSKVKELTEKLRFANETIATLVDARETKAKRRQSGEIIEQTKTQAIEVLDQQDAGDSDLFISIKRSKSQHNDSSSSNP